MFRRLPRKSLLLALLLAIVATAAGFWVLTKISVPTPTPFGWPADLTTVAGDGIRGRTDGPGAAARFSDPFGLAVDAAGTLYVADAGDSNRVRRIDVDGQVTTLPGTFDTPSGLAVDTVGNIIVADTGANAIRRIGADGTVTTIAGDGIAGFRDGPGDQARFDGPIGVAVDEDGTIYVADSYNDRIRLIDAQGQVRTLAGTAAPGFRDGTGAGAAFHTPSGIIVDRDGALLVADTGNDAIRRVGKDGRVSTVALSMADERDGPLRAPLGLAQSWDGFVYISSYQNGRIIQMSPSGELRVLTGGGAVTPENDTLRLASPAGLALGRDGALYVAEASRYVVRKLAPRNGAPVTTAEPRREPPAFVRARRFPWPVAPQAEWQEVVGSLGEVRGNYQGDNRHHFHAGLDIRADVGQTVLAVAPEKIAAPLPTAGFERLSESLRVDAMTYVHMRVGRTSAGASINPARFRLLHDVAGQLIGMRVKRGTRLRVGEPIGTVNSMAHVHLELGPPGGKVNAMALRFSGFTDKVAPRIDAVSIFDAAGRQLTERREGRLLVPANSGALDIIVDAWDQVDRNAPRRRLGIYKAGFQILHANGVPVRGFERPQINLIFDRLPPDTEAVKIAYAEASGVSVHSGQPTRFLYVVTNRVAGGLAERRGWQPTGLTPGDYIIRGFVTDFAGNVGQGATDLLISVR